VLSLALPVFLSLHFHLNKYDVRRLICALCDSQCSVSCSAFFLHPFPFADLEFEEWNTKQLVSTPVSVHRYGFLIRFRAIHPSSVIYLATPLCYSYSPSPGDPSRCNVFCAPLRQKQTIHRPDGFNSLTQPFSTCESSPSTDLACMRLPSMLYYTYTIISTGYLSRLSVAASTWQAVFK
jgi:hypothetical protein